VLTVLFATYNGARTLPRSLEALTRLREPDGGWRLVVVDNASTDGTAGILASYRSRLPLVVLSESRRGQNAARNTGLDARQGDLIVFTDDDVVVDADWLHNFRSCADDNPAYDVFGGPIRPLWESEPPSWVLNGVPLAPAFALTPADLPGGDVRIENCFGPNFAVRSRYFDLGHRFRSDLGPRGRSYPMGGESYLLWHLGRLGARAFFVENAIVQHIIRPWQFEPAWLRRRAYNFGRGLYHKERRLSTPGRRVATLFGIPRWRIRRLLLRAVPRVLASTVGRDQARRVALRWAMWCDLGWLREAMSFRAADDRVDDPG
jgi:glycosyltransferase involved in cell wall biosynthesis